VSTLTLTTIRSLVRSYLNTSSTTMITDAELNSIINDGYRDVASKSLCYESKITKNNISVEKIISLKGEGVIRVNYVEYKSGTTEGGKGLICIIPQAAGHVPITASTPHYWFQWGEFLVIEPIPDAATYDLAIYAACYPATVLSADADIPSALPPEFQECVYQYAVAFSALKLKRWSEAVMEYNKYIADIQQKMSEYISKTPDPRSVRVIPDRVEA
jgi:hypothetical protein